MGGKLSYDDKDHSRFITALSAEEDPEPAVKSIGVLNRYTALSVPVIEPVG